MKPLLNIIPPIILVRTPNVLPSPSNRAWGIIPDGDKRSKMLCELTNSIFAGTTGFVFVAERVGKGRDN